MNAPHEPRLARVAAMIADPARSRMLAYLLGGEYASAGELAEAASVTPATASGHLAKLTQARLVACEPRGRHRYYRLADAEVAHALEALALVAERDQHDRAWAAPQRRELRAARCCYGHLAGQLGVRLFDTLRTHGAFDAAREGLRLTPAGQAWLAAIGFDAPAPNGRRRYAYPCLDWSERRDHLAGQLADAIFDHLIARGWLRRASGRALAVTAAGERELLPLLAAGIGASHTIAPADATPLIPRR
jgi:DNA-binding transcriptional ArsR family regulator